ncbi:hypothetical protein Ciccas_000207 [Cichlidogyrus casuarinus]|uniref:Coiled-coil domain-containing protein 39 n=1 Tax=Cichlidogyrus casuarinus TaxID=1844966 RepID=A0ABD2QNZ9_9PLAT
MDIDVEQQLPHQLRKVLRQAMIECGLEGEDFVNPLVNERNIGLQSKLRMSLMKLSHVKQQLESAGFHTSDLENHVEMLRQEISVSTSELVVLKGQVLHENRLRRSYVVEFDRCRGANKYLGQQEEKLDKSLHYYQLHCLSPAQAEILKESDVMAKLKNEIAAGSRIKNELIERIGEMDLRTEAINKFINEDQGKFGVRRQILSAIKLNLAEKKDKLKILMDEHYSRNFNKAIKIDNHVKEYKAANEERTRAKKLVERALIQIEEYRKQQYLQYSNLVALFITGPGHRDLTRCSDVPFHGLGMTWRIAESLPNIVERFKFELIVCRILHRNRLFQNCVHIASERLNGRLHDDAPSDHSDHDAISESVRKAQEESFEQLKVYDSVQKDVYEIRQRLNSQNKEISIWKLDHINLYNSYKVFSQEVDVSKMNLQKTSRLFLTERNIVSQMKNDIWLFEQKTTEMAANVAKIKARMSVVLSGNVKTSDHERSASEYLNYLKNELKLKQKCVIDIARKMTATNQASDTTKGLITSMKVDLESKLKEIASLKRQAMLNERTMVKQMEQSTAIVMQTNNLEKQLDKMTGKAVNETEMRSIHEAELKLLTAEYESVEQFARNLKRLRRSAECERELINVEVSRIWDREKLLEGKIEHAERDLRLSERQIEKLEKSMKEERVVKKLAEVKLCELQKDKNLVDKRQLATKGNIEYAQELMKVHVREIETSQEMLKKEINAYRKEEACFTMQIANKKRMLKIVKLRYEYIYSLTTSSGVVMATHEEVSYDELKKDLEIEFQKLQITNEAARNTVKILDVMGLECLDGMLSTPKLPEKKQLEELSRRIKTLDNELSEVNMRRRVLRTNKVKDKLEKQIEILENLQHGIKNKQMELDEIQNSVVKRQNETSVVLKELKLEEEKARKQFNSSLDEKIMRLHVKLSLVRLINSYVKEMMITIKECKEQDFTDEIANEINSKLKTMQASTIFFKGQSNHPKLVKKKVCVEVKEMKLEFNE